MIAFPPYDIRAKTYTHKKMIDRKREESFFCFACLKLVEELENSDSKFSVQKKSSVRIFCVFVVSSMQMGSFTLNPEKKLPTNLKSKLQLRHKKRTVHAMSIFISM